MRLVIASRKSDLARIQAYTVGMELKKKHPQLEVKYHFRESLGDLNAQDPLWKMPEKGVFTEDFHQGLLSGEWDMVVHSWKDLPILEREGTSVVATLPREDVRDLLLVKKSYEGESDFCVLTSSPRREHNLQKSLRKLLPWPVNRLQFEPVRGNIPTRIRKLLEGDAHGLVVAKAALDRILSTEKIFQGQEFASDFLPVCKDLRLALQQMRWMILPLQLNPAAAAQGALAIEVKQGREDLKNLLQSIHCQSTFEAVEQERAMLQGWGGGCHQKIGVTILNRSYGKITIAQGLTDNGKDIQIFQSSPEKKLQGSGFPESPQQALWFARQAISVDPIWSTFNAHYVSKTEALPVSVVPSADSLIWVSGLKTWYQLAQRGLWVHGSSESLGEGEDLRLQALDHRRRDWCKWTHSHGEKSMAQNVMCSYVLKPLQNPPVLDPNTEHFFWMSGSSFVQAVSIYPWLVDKTHWSGPGHTHERILKLIKEKQGKGTADIALSFEQWQKMRGNL